MSLRWTPLAPRLLRSTQPRLPLRLRLHRRSYAQTATSPLTRLESRLPRFLQHIITPLRNAPVSHITSFLILHELTAILPLFGLVAAFHYGNWLPPFFSEGKWAKEGAEKYGNYLRKKGWLKEGKRSDRWWGRGEGGVRIVVEFATAYALTKALLPLRLVVSVWATPWFARWTVLPFTRRIGAWFSRGKKGAVVAAERSAGAGTNAVGGGVVSKSAK